MRSPESSQYNNEKHHELLRARILGHLGLSAFGWEMRILTACAATAMLLPYERSVGVAYTTLDESLKVGMKYYVAAVPGSQPLYAAQVRMNVWMATTHANGLKTATEQLYCVDQTHAGYGEVRYVRDPITEQYIQASSEATDALRSINTSAIFGDAVQPPGHLGLGHVMQALQAIDMVDERILLAA